VNPNEALLSDCGYDFIAKGMLGHIDGDPRRRIPVVAKVYAYWCFANVLVLGALGLTAVNSAGWLIYHIAISLATGVAILRRDKAALTAVWILTIVDAWVVVRKGFRPLDVLAARCRHTSVGLHDKRRGTLTGTGCRTTR